MTPAGPHVLHLLAQRPTLTGSGVTLDQLALQAANAGWEQDAVVAAPAEDAAQVAGIPSARIFPLRFETLPLPFPVVGMSDVMPYASGRYSALDDGQWRRLRGAWFEHLRAVAQRVSPDIVHTHHLWLMSSLVREAFPGVPVVTHCHATGLRQMQLCPGRAPEIVEGLRRTNAFAVLDEATGAVVTERLGIEPERVHVVGAGFDDEVFHAAGRDQPAGRHLVYVGKLARAKGLDCLLDAFELLAAQDSGVMLHVAGGGSGDEAVALRARIKALAPRVRLHGQLSQPDLADLLRECDVLALPSFYEGVPLVLCEAAACGCRVVASDLPGVRNPLAEALGEMLSIVPLPAMASVDEPEPTAVAGFVERLADALAAALAARPTARPDLEGFSWRAVFVRVESVWRGLLQPPRH